MSKRSLPSSTESRKVCAVCYGKGAYNVLFMDLDISGAHTNSTDFIDIIPSLRIEYPIPLRFCELNSSLYMFHASNRLLGKRGWEGLPMFKIDLCPDIWNSTSVTEVDLREPNVVVRGRDMGELSLLVRGPDMKTCKRSLDAIKTPDGRILVFSRLIRYFVSQYEYDRYQAQAQAEDEDEDEDSVYFAEGEEDKRRLDFEIFDPKSESWNSLPQLELLVPSDDKSDLLFRQRKDDKWIDYLGTDDPFYGKGSEPLDFDHLRIRGGTFINNNTFLVVVPIGARFILNIDDPDKGWELYEGQIETPESDHFFTVVQDHDLILSPNMAKRGSVSHPLNWTCPQLYLCTQTQCISVLDTFVSTHAQKCIACVVGTGTDRRSLKPFIICDLFCIDLSLQTPPEPLGTFKYFADKEGFHEFLVFSVFPIMVSQNGSSLAINISEAILKVSKSGHVDKLKQKMLHLSNCTWSSSALQKAADYIKLGPRPFSGVFLILGFILGFAFGVAFNFRERVLHKIWLYIFFRQERVE